MVIQNPVFFVVNVYLNGLIILTTDDALLKHTFIYLFHKNSDFLKNCFNFLCLQRQAGAVIESGDVDPESFQKVSVLPLHTC